MRLIFFRFSLLIWILLFNAVLDLLRMAWVCHKRFWIMLVWIMFLSAFFTYIIKVNHYGKLHTLPTHVLFAYDVNPSGIYGLLSSFSLNPIWLNFSVNKLCTSFLYLCCDYCCCRLQNFLLSSNLIFCFIAHFFVSFAVFLDISYQITIDLWAFNILPANLSFIVLITFCFLLWMNNDLPTSYVHVSNIVLTSTASFA